MARPLSYATISFNGTLRILEPWMHMYYLNIDLLLITGVRANILVAFIVVLIYN